MKFSPEIIALSDIPSPSFPAEEWLDYLSIGINTNHERELTEGTQFNRITLEKK